MSNSSARAVLAELPDPGSARDLDELIIRLRLLKVFAGDPSYDVIARRMQVAGCPERIPRSTVAACFTVGRVRPDEDLVLAIVAALHDDAGYLTQWRQAFRIIRGEALMASFVQGQDRLPSPVVEFVGRRTELARLEAHLVPSLAGGRPGVSVIEGMAGVGKTQLAVEAARRLADREDLGQVLSVDLRGFDPDPWRPPADPAAVLDAFLRLLGVNGRDIPQGKDALLVRAKLYRERLRGRRALILLDNAVDPQQVRPLLPDAPGCLALVTSRNDLGDLPGVGRMMLDVFDPDDAITLLRNAAGEERYAAETQTAAVISKLLGRLPLALGLTAERIRADKSWTLADHLSRLIGRSEPLLDERLKPGHEMRLDDPMAVAIGLSYQRLEPEVRRTFRFIARHPGCVIDSYAAAALADIDLAEAAGHLARLAAASLVMRRGPDRYELHDLVLVYAAERARDEDPVSDQHAAVTRLLDHYLYVVSVAMERYDRAGSAERPRIPDPGTPVPALPDAGSAVEWLDRERPNLVAAAAHAAEHDLPGYTCRMSDALAFYLRVGSHYGDAEILHRLAAEATDPGARGRALIHLAMIDECRGRFASAEA